MGRSSRPDRRSGRTKPITPYGWRIDDSFGIYLESTLLAGSHRWNNALREFAHISPGPDGTIYDHGQQILDALAGDRYGIAVSNPPLRGPGREGAGARGAARVRAYVGVTHGDARSRKNIRSPA